MGLFERFATRIAALPRRELAPADLLVPEFRLAAAGPFEVYYAPFDHVNTGGRQVERVVGRARGAAGRDRPRNGARLMALRAYEAHRDELERVEPQAERMRVFVRARDPKAHFVLQPGHDPEFWELDAFVRADLADDPNFAHEIAVEDTKILLDHDVALAVILRPRSE